MPDFHAQTADIIAHIKQCYHAYRRTEDIDRKGLFSPDCLQICRPMPSYAATSRAEIVAYLHEAERGKIPAMTPAAGSFGNSALKDEMLESARSTKSKSVYTIRALHPSEYNFGTDETCAPIGSTPEQLQEKAVKEEWAGMRVDLWGTGRDSDLLVKVQYWWRSEEIPAHEKMTDNTQKMGWRQCLHDIMYLGPKDGTEGTGEVEILE